MLSDLMDVERCSIFLYDGMKDQLFCKVITGRLRDPISFPRSSNNVICTVFNSGQPKHYKKTNLESVQEELEEYNVMN